MNKKIFIFSLFIVAILASSVSAKTQDLNIDGDHGKLSAVLQTPDNKNSYPLVIICHGFTSHKEFSLLTKLADSLEAKGIASLRFDFNGHGHSEGLFQDMTVPNEIEDAKKVFQYAESLPEVSEISIAGHSQGGAVSSMVAGELNGKIKKAVLFAPAAVLRDDSIRGNLFGVQFDSLNPPEYVEIFGGHKVGRNYIKTAQTLPIYETAAKFKGQACMIHGTGDTVVPYTHSLHYHEIWKDSEINIIPEWDHSFTAHKDEAVKSGVEF